ncbi:MAG TPA: O-antigen ligase family protein, partial [Blastocatellia bacterium]|nr:O-antigen ligase family protein [Blastocatellia bacterium]
MLFALPAALAMMRAESREARLFFGFAAIVMVIAAIASLSRGGMISLAATVIFLIVWRWKINSEIRRSRSVYVDGRSSRIVSFIRSGAVAVAVIAVISVGLMWVGPDRIAERVTSGSLTGDAGETFYASRGWIWRDTISMIRDNPVLGVGFGAYETVYPIYSQTSGTLIVGQAHNDYLQILADCGLIGGLLAGWFIWQVSGSISRGVRSRDRLLAGLAMGASAGVFAIMVHSFLDFNLQLISNALLFMMLLSVVFQVERLTTAGRKTGIEAPARGASSRAGALLSR